MSPIAKGFIFAGIGVGVGLIMGLGVFWPLFQLSGGAVAGWTIAWVLFGGLFGFFTAWKGIYALQPRAIWAFIIDISWSSINTIVGLVFLTIVLVSPDGLIGLWERALALARGRNRGSSRDPAVGARAAEPGA